MSSPRARLRHARTGPPSRPALASAAISPRIYRLAATIITCLALGLVLLLIHAG